MRKKKGRELSVLLLWWSCDRHRWLPGYIPTGSHWRRPLHWLTSDYHFQKMSVFIREHMKESWMYTLTTGLTKLKRWKRGIVSHNVLTVMAFQTHITFFIYSVENKRWNAFLLLYYTKEKSYRMGITWGNNSSILISEWTFTLKNS